MAENDKAFYLDEQSAKNLRTMWEWFKGATRASIPGGANGPHGPVFPPSVVGGFRPNPDRPSTILRVAAELDGQEAYQAYVQVRNTNSASITATSNASIAAFMADGEEVVFWNLGPNTAASFTSPAGTNRTHNFPIGKFTPAFDMGFAVMNGTNSRRLFASYQDGGAFPVRTSSDGGANGTGTSTATYTYTCKTLDNVTTLATGQSPQFARSTGRVTAASWGLACYDVDGTFKLLSTDESFGGTTCP
ncbi:MAG TPA: hypothetical protein VGE74_17880 [Gemmata sp.]